MKLKNIISTQQFQDRSVLSHLFAAAKTLEQQHALHQLPSPLAGKILATLFYEPSTRTRLSFEVAIQRLGGQVVTSESAGMFSSAAKGETLADTIRVLNGYVDGVVLRHTDIGSAAEAAAHATIPIINAGDGAGEHPTQALLDLYTIDREKGHLDGQHLALVGDLLHGRTIHSLVQLLPLFAPAAVSLVSPPSLRLPRDLKNLLTEKGIIVFEVTELAPTLVHSDVVYMTRIQKERFDSEEEYGAVKNSFCLGKAALDQMKEDAIILHPLPRVGEIDPEVDSDPRAKYFQQTRHGLYLRMALLQALYSNAD